MNNAIEHSKGSRITYTIQKDILYTEISVADNGIGVFRNIQHYLKEKSGVTLDTAQAALELYKGRMTTDPVRHSGEGIFFSSKMLAEFAHDGPGQAFRRRDIFFIKDACGICPVV